MKTNLHRREFLKKVTILTGASLFAPFAVNLACGVDIKSREQTVEKQVPRINPAFRINKLEGGGIEVFTFSKPGSKISYKYEGLEAGMIMLIGENRSPEENLREIAAAYSLSDSECKIRVSSAMDEFKKKALIYYGEPMKVKKTQGIYEQRISDNN